MGGKSGVISQKAAANLKRLATDFEFRAKNTLKIRSKEGQVIHFELNQAQRYIHERLEQQRKEKGYVRAIILKGRQQGCCYSPEMRVLTADYQWVQIKDVKLGERIIAIDENTGAVNNAGRKTERRIRTAIVEAKSYLKKEAFELITDSGVKLIVTGEHRHLCRKRGGDDAQWREVHNTKIGDYIRVLAPKPSDKIPSFEDGWFGGLLDGEGSFGATPQVRIALSQVDGDVLHRAKKYLETNGIHYYELIDRRKSGISSKLGDKAVHCLRIDRLSDVLKLLTLTRPTRFISRELFIGKKLPCSAKDFNAWAKVVSIKSIGVIDVVDLQTSEKTFICEGLVSHNSTYIAARFYDRVVTTSGLKAFILAHREDATTNLYSLVDRYYENYPLPIRPNIKESNAKRLFFENGSGYGVGTSGGGSVGRSDTIQLLHMSEAAFYEKTDELVSGIMQTVPDMPGTEIILESTANGTGNMFHRMAMQAHNGNGYDYQLIFVPWFWQDEYKLAVKGDVDLSPEEEEYKAMWKLNDGQMMWRRNKIMTSGEWKFKQEYPAYVQEAFEASGEDSFILSELVLKARKCEYAEKARNVIIGVDPAWMGSDMTAIVWRAGRVMTKFKTYAKLDTMQLCGVIADIIYTERPYRIFIDVGGIGAGIYDRLVELGYSDIVTPINFGNKADDPNRYSNKRAEMWSRMRDWFNSDMAVKIPDDDKLQIDFTCVKAQLDSAGRIKLESKEDIRKRIGRSPDAGDALALTFAYLLPVYEDVQHLEQMYEQDNRYMDRSRNSITGY